MTQDKGLLSLPQHRSSNKVNKHILKVKFERNILTKTDRTMLGRQTHIRTHTDP